jgi:hypothetical protein
MIGEHLSWSQGFLALAIIGGFSWAGWWIGGYIASWLRVRKINKLFVPYRSVNSGGCFKVRRQ